MTINYRESYEMFACSGILFNHESPRRGEDFVTRKITKAIARILAGKQKRLVLGNLDAKRDWGHAKDYVHAMWLMLQQETPQDYVIATGETYSIKTFLTEAFSAVGLDWQAYVDFDSQFLRPAEVELLVGDPTKAITELGWQREYDFKALVKEMVEADCLKEGVALALLPSKVVTPV
jgi:GDPmannose 4,6-dehydratase